MRTFEQIANERLKTLTWDTTAGMRKLREREKGGAARVRRPAMAALALLLALAAATALAAGLQISRRVEAKRVARQCVMDTYGLDEETITMFNEHAEEANGVWTVTYHYWAPDQGGVYTVTVDRDGTARASWSLDGQAGAWGQDEIAAEMARKEREYQQIRERERALQPMPSPEPQAEDEARAQAIRWAAGILRERYGITETGMAALMAEGARLELGDWTVTFIGTPVWPEGMERFGTYIVRLSAGDGSCLGAEWSLEGAETGAETVAQAMAYDARCLERVGEYALAREAIGEEWPVSPEHQARLDAMMIDMGFDPARYNHVAPEAGDIPLDKAKELAYQAIHSEFGVSRENYEASVFAYADLTQEPDGRQWYFWIQSQAELTSWTVLIDAQTGEILDLFNESLAAGNG